MQLGGSADQVDRSTFVNKWNLSFHICCAICRYNTLFSFNIFLAQTVWYGPTGYFLTCFVSNEWKWLCWKTINLDCFSWGQRWFKTIYAEHIGSLLRKPLPNWSIPFSIIVFSWFWWSIPQMESPFWVLFSLYLSQNVVLWMLLLM